MLVGANPSAATTPGQAREDEDCVRFLSPSAPRPGLESSPSPSALVLNGGLAPASQHSTAATASATAAEANSPNLILASIERRAAHTATGRPSPARRVSGAGTYNGQSPRAKANRAVQGEAPRPSAPTPNRAAAKAVSSPVNGASRLADEGEGAVEEERKANVGVGAGFEVTESGEAIVDAIVRGGPADLSGQVLPAPGPHTREPVRACRPPPFAQNRMEDPGASAVGPRTLPPCGRYLPTSSQNFAMSRLAADGAENLVHLDRLIRLPGHTA